MKVHLAKPHISRIGAKVDDGYQTISELSLLPLVWPAPEPARFVGIHWYWSVVIF
jgi:hypothetical protein